MQKVSRDGVHFDGETAWEGVMQKWLNCWGRSKTREGFQGNGD
jgi:hypothetical protein